MTADHEHQLAYARALDAPHEPWQPTPGTRVQVRVSPECQAQHFWLSGATGVMVEINWSAVDGPEPRCGDPEADGYRGHWYWVEFDEPADHPTQHRPIVADLFAAIELEKTVQTPAREAEDA